MLLFHVQKANPEFDVYARFRELGMKHSRAFDMCEAMMRKRRLVHLMVDGQTDMLFKQDWEINMALMFLRSKAELLK